VLEPSELETGALELAAEIAGNAPLSQRGNKRVIAALLEAEGELSQDAERELLKLRAASFASEDFGEGVRAFGEKRPPRWQGR
jgi:enoyl-CoA hydratase/carnithine racemase